MTSTALFPPSSPYPFDLQQQLPHSCTPFDTHAVYCNTYLNALALYSQPHHDAPAAPNNPYPTTTNIPTVSQASSAPQPISPKRHSRDSHASGKDAHSMSGLPFNYQHPMQALSFNSMVGPTTHANKGIKRQRDHERTPSASTVVSNGPASPHLPNGSHPRIANTDISPHSPAYYAESSFGKNFPTPSQTPIQSEFLNSSLAPASFGQLTSAHFAMKDFAISHHSDNDYPIDFAPSRQSMSSYGNDSPATPQSGVADMDMKPNNISANDVRQPSTNVQLYRTESQAFQDELYVPNLYTSAPASAPKQPSHNNFLSPHRSLMAERLQAANLTRSASPTSAVSRERSPFRDNSPLAPTRDWNPAGPVDTAAHLRQQQKEETAQAEIARHPPQLQREPTKTISPKDALLEYHDTDQMPLFQDSVPVGYESHKGGTEPWTTNYNSFGSLPVTSQQQVSGFRHANPVDGNYASAGAFDFQLPQAADQIQGNPFQPNYQAAIAAKMNNYDTPDFPAPLPSMETSTSDYGIGPSSQDDPSTSVVQRPDDTRANTGTYTCTYHGCTQRFDSHNNLQKHKRDVHRPPPPLPVTSDSPSVEGSESPRSSGSPAPSGSALSSAAILARNSQAGPHKCTRINPSTNKPCNTIFSRPYDLTRHEDTIHNNRKQKVKCPYCREDKTFSRNDALTRHMRVVHPDNADGFGRRGRRGD